MTQASRLQFQVLLYKPGFRVRSKLISSGPKWARVRTIVRHFSDNLEEVKPQQLAGAARVELPVGAIRADTRTGFTTVVANFSAIASGATAFDSFDSSGVPTRVEPQSENGEPTVDSLHEGTDTGDAGSFAWGEGT